MEIIEEQKEGASILRVSGRLDASTCKSLEEKLLSIIDAGQGRLVIDLSGLDYVSSAGLRVLLLGAKRTGNVKGNLVLCSLKGPVKQVFDIAGFSSLFMMAESVEEALASVQKI